MHCPKCGTPAAGVQKFCRTCGFSLEKVAELLGEPVALTDDTFADAEPAGKQQNVFNRLDKIWMAAAAFFGVAFVTAVCWAIVDKVIIEKGNTISGALFLFFFIGIIVLGLSGMYIESRQKKLAKRQNRPMEPQQPDLNEVSSAETTNKLLPEPALQSAVSVTEQTTSKLAEKIR